MSRLLLRSPWDMLHFACLTEDFPLTLTLSLREREQQASDWCLADSRWANSGAGVIESRWTILLLPRGEGRGEGEPSVAVPTVHSVFDRKPVARQTRMLLVALAVFVLGSRFLEADDVGFGPPISVPRDLHESSSRPLPPRNWIDQTPEEAMRKSRGCLECHQGIDTLSMHASPNVVLGCADCHGGNPMPGLSQRKAHVQPRHPIFWQSSANPSDSDVLLNHESLEFIRFVNPGDLLAAEKASGLCHDDSVRRVFHSMMNHGAMLWGAALYNNGSFPLKNYRFGQAYGPGGEPLKLINPEPVTPADTHQHGILPFIEPLPRFPLSQPGNILRIFEKGGEKQLQLGIPTTTEPPGRPLRRLSERGLGTLNCIDPVFLNLQKTRLHDPLLGFLGSNNHPGDYRSSGCSACHVDYANDRSPTHSGWYSKYGNQGLSFTGDSQISQKERGYPIRH